MVSVITPHRNDLTGIQRILGYLNLQTSDKWEWIIIDDCSDIEVQEELNFFISNLKDIRIKIALNENKKSASGCRNIGVDLATYSTMVFLDSDDTITNKFIENRSVEVKEFKVFKNFKTIDGKNKTELFSKIDSHYLENFLMAKFAWQTTAILWNKDFFIKIGKFNESLILLEDIELSIRALLRGSDYDVHNNTEIDFYYYVKPIDIEKRNVEKVCSSVVLFIDTVSEYLARDSKKSHFLKGYYYLCIRYLHRSNSSKDSLLVENVLRNLYSKDIVTIIKYNIGMFLLRLYKFRLISNNLFLRTNRYYFK